AAAVVRGKFQGVAHLGLARDRIDAGGVGAAGALVGWESRWGLVLEPPKRGGAPEVGFVLLPYYEFIFIAHRHSRPGTAWHGACRVARGGNALADSEIPLASRGGSPLSREVPARHLFIENHSHAIGKLRIEKWPEQRVLGHLFLRGAGKQ